MSVEVNAFSSPGRVQRTQRCRARRAIAAATDHGASCVVTTRARSESTFPVRVREVFRLVLLLVWQLPGLDGWQERGGTLMRIAPSAADPSENMMSAKVTGSGAGSEAGSSCGLEGEGSGVDF